MWERKLTEGICIGGYKLLALEGCCALEYKHTNTHTHVLQYDQYTVLKCQQVYVYVGWNRCRLPLYQEIAVLGPPGALRHHKAYATALYCIKPSLVQHFYPFYHLSLSLSLSPFHPLVQFCPPPGETSDHFWRIDSLANSHWLF